MSASYDLVTGDTGSVLRVTCKDRQSKVAINLTACVVELHWMNKSGVLQTRTMTIADAANGVVTYQFLAGEIEASSMKFEVQITNTQGKIVTNLTPIELSVRKEIG